MLSLISYYQVLVVSQRTVYHHCYEFYLSGMTDRILSMYTARDIDHGGTVMKNGKQLCFLLIRHFMFTSITDIDEILSFVLQ